MGAGISVFPSKLLCAKAGRVAQILPSEDPGSQTLVTPPYTSPQEYGRSLTRHPTPRKPERTMSKKNKNDKNLKSTLDSDTKRSGVNGQPKIGKKEYEAEIFKLQVELVKLQDWVKATDARIVIIFEGRDAAGKGGMIKRIMERVSPRIFRVALPAPTESRKRSSLPSATLNNCLPGVKS